jgi:hypothetical protein
MSFTTYATSVAGSILTAAFLNQQLRDNGNVTITSIETSTGKLSGNIKNHYEDVGTPAIASNVLTIDCGSYVVIDVTFNANITTTTINNIPASGKEYSLEIYLKANGSAFTWAWLTSTVVWDAGVAPSFVTTANHYMRFLVSTKDGGTIWRGLALGSNYGS